MSGPLKLVRPIGLEPITFGSGGRRSIHVSYGRIIISDLQTPFPLATVPEEVRVARSTLRRARKPPSTWRESTTSVGARDRSNVPAFGEHISRAPGEETYRGMLVHLHGRADGPRLEACWRGPTRAPISSEHSGGYGRSRF